MLGLSICLRCEVTQQSEDSSSSERRILQALGSPSAKAAEVPEPFLLKKLESAGLNETMFCFLRIDTEEVKGARDAQSA